MTASDLAEYEQIEAAIVRAVRHRAWELFAEAMAAGVPPKSRAYVVSLEPRALRPDEQLDHDEDGEPSDEWEDDPS